MPLPEDTILENRYRIDRLLGQGGMGAIYRGYDTRLDIDVAIKENFFQTPQSIQQFQQEARILAKLKHPSLPGVLDHFSHEGQQYLVMEFVEGEDLWQIIKQQRKPLEEKQALKYMVDICDAVHYLHEQKPPIIHRDIKPQNIKITPTGKAVLVDFGIAKIAEEGSRTRTGAQAVTPGFSPPEQYSGGLGTTPVSDVYSLGATLYAILTGQKPPDSISRMVSQAEFKPANVINAAISERVNEAIDHAMQPQANGRPRSAAAWKEELEQILSGAPKAVAAVDDDKETLLPGTVMAPVIDKEIAKEEESAAAFNFWLVDSSGLGYGLSPEPLIIGRSSEADVLIKVLSASREHALVRAEGGNCYVMDNDSANGTFINERRIQPKQWYPLKTGDLLEVGTTPYNISTTPPSKVAPPSLKPRSKSLDDVETAQEPARFAPVVPPPIVEPPPTQPPPQPVARPAPPSTAPLPQPQPGVAAKKKSSALPIIMAVVILLAAIGGAIFFLLNSGAVSTPTPTAVTQDETGASGIVAAGETQPQEGETVDEAAVAARQEAEMTATAEAEEGAASTRQTQEAAERATAEAELAVAETEEEEAATATPTAEPPAARPTEQPPTTTPSPTATQAASAASTPTRSAAPTNTPASAAAGPTLVPLQSDATIQQIGQTEVVDVDINLKNPNEVYVLVKGDGIYKSSNGGDGPWARVNLDGAGLTAFVIDPTNPTRFYAPTWNAVLKSEDGGNTWKAFGQGLSTSNRSVDVVTVDSVNPNVLYGGIGATLVVSTDGGQSWQSDGYGNGLAEGRLTSIVIDPFNNNTLFVGGEFGSLYRSIDSGRTFLQLAFNTGRGLYGMAAHPTQRDVYLAGLNSYDAGIMKTENGADFVSSSNGLIFGGADSAYSAIVYAPSNPNIVYTGSGYEDDSNAKGIFKSTDGGKSWTRISNGLSINPTTGQPHYVKSIAVQPTNPDIVLAATGGGLYKSTNGGASWTQK